MTYRVSKNYSPRRCTPSRRCKDWKHCPRCAAVRQAEIATACERLEAECGHLRWHILYPDQRGQAALEKARANWLRTVSPKGAIWTVEQSSKTGALHCNIITPAQHIYQPRAAAYWHQAIAGDVRNVGAYISKRGQFPKEHDYTGRLYGTAGQLWQILAEQRIAPVVQAAALQYALDSHKMLERAAWLKLNESQQNRLKWAAQESREKAAKQMTLDEAREIAAKWLPDLAAFKARKPSNSDDR